MHRGYWEERSSLLESKFPLRLSAAVVVRFVAVHANDLSRITTNRGCDWLSAIHFVVTFGEIWKLVIPLTQ